MGEVQRTLLPHRSTFMAAATVGAVATPILSPAPPRKGHLYVIDVANGDMRYHLTTNLRDTQQDEGETATWTSVTGDALRHTVCTTLLPHLCSGEEGGEAAVRLLCDGVPVRNDAYLLDGAEVRVERVKAAAVTAAMAAPRRAASSHDVNVAETRMAHDEAAMVVTPIEVSLSASQKTERRSPSVATYVTEQAGEGTTYLGALRAEVARLHRCASEETARFRRERDDARARARTQYDELARYIATCRASRDTQRAAMTKEVAVQLAGRARVQRARQAAQQRTAVLRDRLYHTVAALDAAMRDMQALWHATGGTVGDDDDDEHAASDGTALARRLIVSSAHRQVLEGRCGVVCRGTAVAPRVAQEQPMSGPVVRVVGRLRPCSTVPWRAQATPPAAKTQASQYSVDLDVPRRCVVLRHPAKGVRRVGLDAVYAAQTALNGCHKHTASVATDNVSDGDSLFAREVAPLLRQMCRQGRPVCVLAYGGPGSGKSHTLFGRCDANGADVVAAMTIAAAPVNADAVAPNCAAGISRVSYAAVVGNAEEAIAAAACAEEGALDGTLAPRQAELAVDERQSEGREGDAGDGRTNEAASADGDCAKETRQEEGPLLSHVVAWLMSHQASGESGGAADDCRVHRVNVAVYELYRGRLYDLLDATDGPPVELALERRAGLEAGGTEPAVPARRVAVAGAGAAVQLIAAALNHRHARHYRRNATGSRGHVFVDFSLTVSATTMTMSRRAGSRAAQPLQAPLCICDEQQDTLLEALGLDTLWHDVDTTGPQRRVRRHVRLVLVDLAAPATSALPAAPHGDSSAMAHAAAWADEARHINRELAALGNVLAALSHPQSATPSTWRRRDDVAALAIAARGTSDVVRVWDVVRRPGMSFSRSSPIVLPASGTARPSRAQSGPCRQPVAVACVPPSLVPYRDSRLTEVLQPVLAGGGQALFIACLRPCEATEVDFVTHDGAPLHCTANKAAHIAQLLFAAQAPQLMAEAQATLAFAQRLRAPQVHIAE